MCWDKIQIIWKPFIIIILIYLHCLTTINTVILVKQQDFKINLNKLAYKNTYAHDKHN